MAANRADLSPCGDQTYDVWEAARLPSLDDLDRSMASAAYQVVVLPCRTTEESAVAIPMTGLAGQH